MKNKFFNAQHGKQEVTLNSQDKKPGFLSRRNFFKLIGGTGVAGAAAITAGCSKAPAGGTGWLPQQYHTASHWPVQVKGRVPIDISNPSIARDDRKCILCGQCIEVCKNTQTVFGYYDLPLKNDIICTHCGQCAMWCPTAAITERDDVNKVVKALDDKNTFVVVQTAPATRIALGEEFGLSLGSNVEGRQVAALKKLGFDAVFDTGFTADLTIMEEASELIKRLKEKTTLPQFTSCCPGWVKFCEYYYPDFIPHLSTAKSPQQMLGTLTKTYYAEIKGINPNNIISVAIMPCTAKKFEAQRPEMATNRNLRDVDIVLTTREIARLIKMRGLDITTLEEAQYDNLLGESSGAGMIFAATGGVTEAAVRTAHYLATNEPPPEPLLSFTAVRGLKGVKEASIEIPGLGHLNVAVCHGLKNARIILDKLRSGEASWDFIEVMACDGGCIGGGGQPRTALPPSDKVRTSRIAGIYNIDKKDRTRLSYENEEIQLVYKNFLVRPLSDIAEELLHTHYSDRSEHLITKKNYSLNEGDSNS
ncbi:Iron hydrogenase 1 [bioreactor metagenome]|uniref:Iron hydrogenase 1 n=1 Tax=bioreactor metagenome TaxID=1076179 RepID=A0A644URA1_9ZZZZ